VEEDWRPLHDPLLDQEWGTPPPPQCSPTLCPPQLLSGQSPDSICGGRTFPSPPPRGHLPPWLLETPHISPIGVVPKKNGSSQLIINMQLLNVAISPPHFKYEDLALLASLLKEGDYMKTINLKDRFFHVPVLSSHQAYMSFQWEGKTYVFQVLPFGMSTLPWLFTCFVQAMVHHLCCQGMLVMAYIDNFIIIGHSHQQALEHTTCTLHLLNQLGWQVNFEKPNLTPSQSKKFLGLLIDTRGPPSFKVPPRGTTSIVCCASSGSTAESQSRS